ncbi:hypothetical protein [Leptospira barantonii]|nr:hypothetical protein [Leptospira barantonii]
MIKDDNSPGGGQDSGMDELQFDDIDSMLGSNEPEPSKSGSGGLEDMSIEADPLESLIASSGEEYPSSFENDFSFHPEESSSSLSSSGGFNLDEDSLDLELTDPLIDAEIDKLLDIDGLSGSGTSSISNLENDDSFFMPADESEHSDTDFSELDSYLTEEPDAISFGEELDDLDEFGLPDDLHDEGPISLHEDDLQGVKPDFSLQDFTMEDDHETEELDHGDLSFDEDDFLSEEEGPITLSEDELGEIASTESPIADFSNPGADEEENITLSDSELGGILDEGDGPDWSSSPSSMTLDDMEDEGPVALSGNELDDILGTGAPESASSTSEDDDLPDFITHTDDEPEEEYGVPSMSEETPYMEESGFDFQPSKDSLDGEEDEGSIALSEDELGNLLADNTEEAGDSTGSNDSFDFSSNIEDLSSAEPSTTSDFSLDGEDEEPISLSLEELDNIQSDGGSSADTLDDMAPTAESDFDFQPVDSLDGEEDNEPIALSEEELGNLLSDDTTPSASEEISNEGFADLLDGGDSLSEDTGSMFSEDDSFSLPVEQNLGGPDEFGLAEEETIPDHSDFSFEPDDSMTATEESNEDDGEPIALSEEELGNLLSSDQEEGTNADSLFEENSTGEEDDLISLPVDELDGLGETAETTSTEDDSLSFDDFELPTNDLDALETETPSDSFLETSEEDNEPIALSDEELGNLLATDGAEDTNDDVSSFDFAPETSSSTDEEGAEEPISLSLDELDHILTDDAEPETSETFPGSEEEIDWDSPLAETADSNTDAEEPIALSSDELDHILTDDAEPASVETFPGSDTEIDWDAPLSEQEEVPLEDEEPIALSTDELDHILTSEEDMSEDNEGPIALSEDELGNLLSDVEAPEEEGQDLNELLGELPAASDLDAFESMDEDVSTLQPLGSTNDIIPTAETVDEEEMIIVLDEYADEEELSPMEELRKTPDEDSPAQTAAPTGDVVPSKEEMKRIMTYLDELLGNLPDDLIREFSQSDYFELYKKLMKQIGV